MRVTAWRRLAAAGVVAGAVMTAIAIAIAPPATAAERCSLSGEYRATSVTPLKIDQHAGIGTYARAAGAEMFIPAQPGLTREWLNRTLDQEIARGDCDFGSSEIQVEVLSSGPGFVVRVIGPDDRSASEILRRAQQMSGKPSERSPPRR